LAIKKIIVSNVENGLRMIKSLYIYAPIVDSEIRRIIVLNVEDGAEERKFQLLFAIIVALVEKTKIV
jgi:hypothetical protein